MTRPASPGALFRKALQEEQPLQVIGAINANHALLAKRAGYRAIYLSGGGVAAGSLGMPDLGINTLDDVLTDVRRITDVRSEEHTSELQSRGHVVCRRLLAKKRKSALPLPITSEHALETSSRRQL